MDLVARVKGILLNPRREWETIDTEPASVAGLYTGYIIPLAGAAAVAAYIGLVVFGFSVMGITTKYSMVGGLRSLVFSLVMSLAMVFLFALLIDAMAPTFNAEKNQLQALKLVAFSMTPAWIGGLFAILPALSWIGLIGGLYGLYLLFIGLPVMMKAPKEKALGYTITAILGAIVIGLILGAIMRAIAPGAMGY